ncbi:MAG: RpiR family transcriptional regulator [Chloroflexi bacterium]|nr:MAG: RpiR family transcriptional regulator [Chloroflexota bacterium]MBA4376113.1 MurR/RpiR family transcriptional regulator [Anaerolinea sp.]
MIETKTNEKINAITKIRSRTLALSESERRVASWILDHADKVLYLSMSQIAQECEVSDTTVLRMCRNAGFIGFTDLKLSLAQDMASPTQLIHESIIPSDDPLTIVQKVFTSNIQALYDTLEILDEATLNKTIQLIENARHILIAGVGGSSIIAQNLYQRLFRLGIPCDAPLDVQLQIMHSTLLMPGDLAIAVSYSGSTKDMDLVFSEAKRNGASTILITGNMKSKLADQADLVLVSVSHEIRSEPVAARNAQLTLVDSIFILYSFLHMDQSLAVEKKIANSVVSKSY